MNNDLISRKALKKAITEATYNFEQIPIRVDKVQEIIDNAPTVEPEKVLVANVSFDDNKLKEIVQTEVIDKIKNGELVLEAEERPQGEWIVIAEDNDGVHRICCPFCSYEKGSNNTDTIIVTFSNFPKFCENCGADMQKGGAE